MSTLTFLRHAAIKGDRALTCVQKARMAEVIIRSISVLSPTDQFERRHMGPSPDDAQEMLEFLGFKNMDDLIKSAVPEHIRLKKELDLDPSLSETEALSKLKNIVNKNVLKKSLIGMGYYETITPGVILRNMLENPGWYTAYTPYQAEISQGRLESLLNFQTMVADLTGMEMSNASLLDESTAAAEAMTMCFSLTKKRSTFFVADDCHPQTIALCQTRGDAAGIKVVVGNPRTADFGKDVAGVLLQYPNTYGSLEDLAAIVDKAHAAGALAVGATDLLALTLARPPSEFGFDIAVGSAQRLGVPMGYGGPHAAFMATNMNYARKMPGRIIGVSVDVKGRPALRMAMQTREQHIRRDKATSNICTAQALLANMASAYGVYHGPEGMKKIAARIHAMAKVTAELLTTKASGISLAPESSSGSGFFDTVVFDLEGMTAAEAQAKAIEAGFNIRAISDSKVGMSFGESLTSQDLCDLVGAFGVQITVPEVEAMGDSLVSGPAEALSADIRRTTEFMTHPVFNSHHSETQMLRFLKRLENKDLALNTSMISLGSCTMKLNATSEMAPVTWPEICSVHPFVPENQVEGYLEMIESLNKDLAEITGFTAVSAQPNSGAQGEYAGLLCIRAYHRDRGDHHRNICLIPVSAHGTNPASAVMSGMKVVKVETDNVGNIDMKDLKAKAEKYKDTLAALMVTYPSTFGVFEEGIIDICQTIHDNGGLVYMDGANMNAQVGLTSPGRIGADVCHLNLHKTFCIPHGGGGPGVGSIGVNEKLAPYLPGHTVLPVGGEGDGVVPKSTGAVAAAPFGSAAILPISWMYIKMLGGSGLKMATEYAILNANYMASRLGPYYNILYTGTKGQCAHEFIIDLRPYKSKVGISEEDVAKRLQDYGFHSPTMSWPVGGTLMVEPTESEDKAELDRFCEAMIRIRGEIDDIASGVVPLDQSPLTNAPHTLQDLLVDAWDRPYSKEQGCFPAPWVRSNKFWPTVGRIDNVHGDRNLICSCPPVDSYGDEDDASAPPKVGEGSA